MAAATRVRSDYAGDLMWIDSSWLSHDYANGGPYYVCFQFDPTVFPDPGGMIKSLRDAHFHFGASTGPGTLDIYPGGSTSYTLYEDDGTLRP